MQHSAVAHGPWDTAQNRDEGGKSGAREPAGLLVAIGRIPEPGEQERQEGNERGVGHEREAPEEAVRARVAQAPGLSERECGPQNRGNEQGGKRSVPDPLERNDDGIGEDGPKPGGSGGAGDSPRGVKALFTGPNRRRSNRRSVGIRGKIIKPLCLCGSLRGVTLWK